MATLTAWVEARRAIQIKTGERRLMLAHIDGADPHLFTLHSSDSSRSMVVFGGSSCAGPGFHSDING
jgi:hypothetical protein